MHGRLAALPATRGCIDLERIQQFEADTGISVEVRYAGSAELAATILEEGENSPADVFFAQDPASLGAVALGGYFRELDPSILDKVDPAFSALRRFGTMHRQRAGSSRDRTEQLLDAT